MNNNQKSGSTGAYQAEQSNFVSAPVSLSEESFGLDENVRDGSEVEIACDFK
ncbi:MAG: hypothetical protein M3367_10915 [Acidobacteriota bacterium]|nr:hypothetical protein [Acidobacteriota bacterium]